MGIRGEPALVLVRWIDSESDIGWEPVPELGADPTCESVGWVIGEDERLLMLCATREIGGEETNLRIRIPKACILSRQLLSLQPPGHPDG